MRKIVLQRSWPKRINGGGQVIIAAPGEVLKVEDGGEIDEADADKLIEEGDAFEVEEPAKKKAAKSTDKQD